MQNSFGHGNVAGLSGFGSGSVSCPGIKEPFQIKKKSVYALISFFIESWKNILHYYKPKHEIYLILESNLYGYALMKLLIFSTHSMKYIWYTPQESKYPLLTLECLLKEMSVNVRRNNNTWSIYKYGSNSA